MKDLQLTKFSVRTPILIPLASALLSWGIIETVTCPKSAFSQTSQTVPTLPAYPQILPPPETSEAQIPPGTFKTDFIPPQGYSPPAFEDNPSNPFNVYRLGVGDAITVNVERFPEFSFTSVIDPEGNIFVPILGQISLLDFTLEEVETKISTTLGSTYLQENPKVTARLTGPRPVEVTILGEIVRPGFYVFPPGIPINNILVAVGGSTKDADLRSIILRRSLSDGTVIERKVDVFTPLQTGKKLPNIRLQGGDTIIVSKMEVGSDQGYDRDLLARTSLVQQTIRVRIWNRAIGGISVINVATGTTMLDILANVGANNPELVNIREIGLLRFDPENGGVIKQFIDGKTAITGDLAQDVLLQDEDVLVVGRTLFGKIIAALNIVTRPFRDLFSFIAFINTLYNVIDPNN